MSGCPSGDQLARLSDGTLDAASLRAIEAHVAGCLRCAADLASRRGTVRQRPAAAARRDRSPAVRELEAAATLASHEFLPVATTTPIAAAPHEFRPVAATTPIAATPHAAAAPRTAAVGTPYSSPVASGTSRSAPRTTAPRRARPSRGRGSAIAIACAAAIAGVAAALAIAHVVRDQPRPAQPAATAGSATPTTAGSAASAVTAPVSPAPPAEPPSSAAVTAAHATAPATTDHAAPAKPAGVPLPPAPPRAGGRASKKQEARATPEDSAKAEAPTKAPTKTEVPAVSSPSASLSPNVITDLSDFMRDVQRAIRRRDIPTCKRLVAGVGKDVHPNARFTVELFGSMCDMMGGDCAGGNARLARAFAAQEKPFQDGAVADQYCAIEGNLKTRLARLLAQTNLHANSPVIDIAWCDALIPHARKLAGEVTAPGEKALAAYIAMHLAGCFAHHGQCADATSAAAVATKIGAPVEVMPVIAEKCPSAP